MDKFFQTTDGYFYSIIVPVYRVEAFVGRCIESVLCQTFKSFELILIDDGSPDSSGRICDDYAVRDFRIKVIHTSNGGVSCARNIGISHALGSWLIFLDADDTLFKSDVLEVMYKQIILEKADIYQYQIVHLKEGKQNRTSIKPGFFYISGNDYKHLKPKRGQASNYIFKSEYVKNNGIYFPEGVRISEDQAFTYSYLAYCDTIKVCDVPFYVYHVSENPYSSGSAYIRINSFQDVVGHIKATQQIILHSMKSGKNRSFIAERVAMMILYIINLSIILSAEDRKLIHKQLKKEISFSWRYLINNKGIFVAAIFLNLSMAILLFRLYRVLQIGISCRRRCRLGL